MTEKSTEKNGNSNTTKTFLAAKVAAGPLSWDSTPTAGMTLKSLELDSLDPNPEQARKNFDEDQLFELASSILVRGLMMPISASPEVENLGRPTGRHYIVAGERRVRSFRMLRDAAKNEATARHMAERARKHYTGEEGESLAQLWLGLAGSTEALQKFATIPAIVEAAKDSAARLLDGLTENLLRENLHSLEEADSFAHAVRAKTEGGLGLTAEQLGGKLGKDVQYIRRRLHLAACPSIIRKAMTEGILVTKRDEDGKAIKRGEGADATEVQERRTIEDLSIGLELAKLHAMMMKGLDAPQQRKAKAAAEERFAGILDQALSKRWSVRKLEELRKELAESGGKKPRKSADSEKEGEGASAGAADAAPKPSKPAWTDDEKTLSVRRDRLANLPDAERAKLRARLQELLSLLG